MSEITVRRGGKIVRVTENELEKYITKGYEIVGGKLSGNSTQPTPKTIDDLKLEEKQPVAEKTPVRRKRNK